MNMVSRIDIGPDGGPYVAINENSNDLELQDINGNVIAKWDETAGAWDLNNNSLTGINAIDASSATLDSGTIATESTTSDAIVRFSQLSTTQNVVTVQTYNDLPDPTTLSDPVIYRVTDADDYAVPTTGP